MKIPLFLFFSVVIATAVQAENFGIRLLFKGAPAKSWDGSIGIAEENIAARSGWKFEQTDQFTAANAWTISTRPVTQRGGRRSNNPLRDKLTGKKAPTVPMSDNGIVLAIKDADPSQLIEVKTEQGDFKFAPGNIEPGVPMRRLDQSVLIERVAYTIPFTKSRRDDDWPALAASSSGEIHAVHVAFTPGLPRPSRLGNLDAAPDDYSHLAKAPGGDQIMYRRRTNGTWSAPIAITENGRDVMRCAVAEAGPGNALVAWAEKPDDGEFFAVWVKPVADGVPGESIALSKQPNGNAHSPVATTDSEGRVWVAWMQDRGGKFGIFARHQTSDNDWSNVIQVSNQSGNCWAPAIAASEDGRVAIVWDTYEHGDYDIWMREFGGETESSARPVANSTVYESRPGAVYDNANRLWIAFEEGGNAWGKDWGAYDRNDGIGLYKGRLIALRILDNGEWKEPVADWASALPGLQRGGSWSGLAWSSATPKASMAKATTTKTVREKGEEAETTGARPLNALGRLAKDGNGNIWLFTRTKEGRFHTPIGSVWNSFACRFDGEKWHGPVLLPHSDNLLHNQPAAVPTPDGLAVLHSTDFRQSRHRNLMTQARRGERNDPYINNLFLSEFPAGKKPEEFALEPISDSANPDKTLTQRDTSEREDIAAIRKFRIDYNGTELRPLRGEFHRHTEISFDGGGDGTLDEMWRYAVDVADFDWMGNGDHDNGGHREYAWWLTQKTTDAFRIPGVFEPPFTYERSVSYPEGHRNVVFVQRGVRTLQRLPKSDRRVFAPAPDTEMLYEYLHHFDGICASHTSATGMGTDWRNHDPVVEPMVEIYQGARQNYERPGAPRSPTKEDAIGGFEPLGFINLALKKGYKFSFQASSDHGSTHISYAIVYAIENSRKGIVEAMKARHTYGATDNIIADLRCEAGGKNHMMGDVFKTSIPPELKLHLEGTDKFAKVTLVKDDEELKVWEPGTQTVDLSWTDPAPEKGVESYYYFRGEQADGELVWVSPMWITYQ
ncbi:MAG: hypothetical protein AAGA58_09575 [Verrucomicrobiota bacterium]